MVFVKQRRAWASLVPRSVKIAKPLQSLKYTYFWQEKRRIAETGGEVLPVCEGRDVNALAVDVHPNPGGLHRLHADLPGEWLC